MTGPTLIVGPHEGRTFLYEWTLVGNETGNPVVVPHKGDKTIHGYGVFGGAVSIEGSLESFGSSAGFKVLTNPGGVALSGFTATFLETILQNVNQIRPVAAAGIAGVTVRLLIVGFFHMVLTSTRWGLHTVAVGGNLLGATEAGIRAGRIKIGNFMIVATLGGFAGIMDAFRINTIDPNLGGGTTIMFAAVSAAVLSEW